MEIELGGGDIQDGVDDGPEGVCRAVELRNNLGEGVPVELSTVSPELQPIQFTEVTAVFKHLQDVPHPLHHGVQVKEYAAVLELPLPLGAGCLDLSAVVEEQALEVPTHGEPSAKLGHHFVEVEVPQRAAVHKPRHRLRDVVAHQLQNHHEPGGGEVLRCHPDQRQQVQDGGKELGKLLDVRSDQLLQGRPESLEVEVDVPGPLHGLVKVVQQLLKPVHVSGFRHLQQLENGPRRLAAELGAKIGEAGIRSAPKLELEQRSRAASLCLQFLDLRGRVHHHQLPGVCHPLGSYGFEGRLCGLAFRRIQRDRLCGLEDSCPRRDLRGSIVHNGRHWKYGEPIDLTEEVGR
eukprot:RCo022124